MFNKILLTQMDDIPHDFSLDLYVLYFAQKQKKEIYSFPVRFEKRIFGEAKGGGTLKGKLKLIKRTFTYMIKLRKSINNSYKAENKSR